MNRAGSHPDLSALLRRSRRGDEASARALLDAIGPSMRLYARSILRDHDLAEDAMQAALLAIFDATEREIDQIRDAQGWLLAITRRKAISMARADSRRRAREQRATPPSPPSPHAVHTSHDEFRRVRDVVASLPRRLREVIVLTSACGMTLDQAAHAMNANRNTVAWWKREALDRLHTALTPEPILKKPFTKATPHG
jgi:RNA polymerase sigma-70 factor (ECF subfamily)